MSGIYIIVYMKDCQPDAGRILCSPAADRKEAVKNLIDRIKFN
jgi:hypothetical protein